MLQQTQAATVARYFERFLARFPTIESLVAARLDDVLAHWAGMGYYARARNLHRAAQRIVADHGGRIPRTVEQLLRLPGVGRYTAGAVASIAYDRRAPVVDGNVARVLARLFALQCDVSGSAGRTELWNLAERLLPARRCGRFNQALMELGATICTPASPACDRCPLARQCRARAERRIGELPRVRRGRRPKTIRMLTIAVGHRGRVLIRRRADSGLWGGLWELPSLEVATSSAARDVWQQLIPPPLRRDVAPARPVGRLTHVLTHRRILLELYATELGDGRQSSRLPGNYKWLAPGDGEGIGLSAAQRKLLALYQTHRK